MRNLFILGLDDFNAGELESVRPQAPCRFLPLLARDRVRPSRGEPDFEELRIAAGAELARHRGTIDGIAAYLDFPSSALAGVLRNERHLPGPSNQAVARCEHKYWSRCEQRRVVPDLLPAFCAVDPFTDDPERQIEIDYPLWLKPVKSHSSHLGFRIRSRRDLEQHMPEIREKIGRFGNPFNQYLEHVPLPEAVARVDGCHCIAEGIISAGRQCTLEGYVHQGCTTIYGAVDSIRAGRQRSSFSRYQYPSRLPGRVRSRMAEAATRIVRQLGYDNAPFNMEFFWNPRSDALFVLEINARVSKSHCPLFRLVDGASHHQIMVDLALGQEPAFPRRQGRFRTAAKFMIRTFQDGVVRRVPHSADLERVSARYPDVRVNLLVREGVRLSQLAYQDSYSFELAELFVGGDNERDLLKKRAECLAAMRFDIDPAQEAV